MSPIQEVQICQGICVARLDGALLGHTLNLDTANPFEDCLGSSWKRQKVVLDMSQVDYVDSAGVGWLLSCVKQMSQQGGELALAGLRSSIQQVFELMRIGEILTWHETIEMACQKIQTPQRCAA